MDAKFIIYLVIMFGVTYLIRVLPLLLIKKKRINLMYYLLIILKRMMDV